MGNSSNGAFPATSRRKPAVLRRKIFVLGLSCCLGCFGEGSFYPGVASAGVSALPLARALVVARTYLGPRSQMSGAGESTHVGPSLRQYLLGTATAHPGYRVQPFNGLLIGSHPSGYLSVQFLKLQSDGVQDPQVTGKHKPWVRTYLAPQRLLEERELVPEFAFGQVSQHIGVGLTGCQARSIASPEAPITSLATQSSLMLAASSTFWIRLAIWARF
jgi:hypothetical protein